MSIRWFARLGSGACLVLTLVALAGCGAPEASLPLVDGGTDATAAPAPPAGGSVWTALGSVQGASDVSPLLGEEIHVRGVVTGVFPALGGFFLQAYPGEEDDDPLTPDALFILRDGTVPPAGHGVEIRGTVLEVGEAPPTLTALHPLELVDRGAVALEAQPRAVRIIAAPDAPEDWGRYAGILVELDLPVTVVGHFGLQRFGEMQVSLDGRTFQPTELHPPGPAADSLARWNARHLLVLDDGSPGQWPRAIPYLADWPSHDAPLRLGTRLAPGIRGIVDVRRGEYLLLPLEEVQVGEEAPRPAPPRLEADPDLTLRIAVLNVENLFNGDGRGGGFPTPRGAQTPGLYRVQQAKLVATLQALEVDVAALSEVENDGVGPYTALAQFAEALNRAGPARDWRAVEVADGPGTDAIRVAFLYREERVETFGPPVVPSHPIFRWGSRPPLGQAFRLRGAPSDATPWLVVANHLKSKGGCPQAGDTRAAPGDFDLGDGQSCWNVHRVTAAGALAEWLAGDPAGVGAERALIVGDLNSYAQEDPIRLLETEGWVDAFAGGGASRPRSYVFQGLAGRLDHVLIHTSQTSLLRGAAIWHSNADEFTGFGYEYDPESTVWRSSDHDVLLVGVEVR